MAERHLFTAENAASYGRKGAAATKASRLALIMAPPPTDQVLEDVHVLLARFKDRLLIETDPAKVTAWARAYTMLLESERVVAGRDVKPAKLEPAREVDVEPVS